MLAKKTKARSDGGSSFRTLSSYIADKEKAGAVFFSNLESDSLEMAQYEVAATQNMNVRAGKDKTMHIVLSLREGESLTVEQYQEVERRFCEALGYGNHQRICAVHTNTEHEHLHIAINKVDPVNFHNITRKSDYAVMFKMARETERDFGLKEGFLDVQQEEKTASAKVHHEGVKSFDVFVKETYNKQDLKQAIKNAKTWQEIHTEFHKYGLELKPKNAGMIIEDKERPGLQVKPSSIDRNLTRKFLEEKLGLGPYQPPDLAQLQAVAQIDKYEEKPIHKAKESTPLWDKFTASKAANLEKQLALKAEMARIKAEGQQEKVKELASRLMSKREMGIVSRSHEAEIRAKLEPIKKALQATYYRENWQGFLIKEAMNGNEDALKVLRSRPGKRPEPTAENIIERPVAKDHEAEDWQAFSDEQAAEKRLLEMERPIANERESQEWQELSAEQALFEYERPFLPDPETEEWQPKSEKLLKALEAQIRKDGTISYKLNNWKALTDTGEKIHVENMNQDTVLAGLKLATKNFGNKLQIDGSDEFKALAIQLAVKNPELQITFKDAKMELMRSQFEEKEQAIAARKAASEAKKAAAADRAAEAAKAKAEAQAEINARIANAQGIEAEAKAAAHQATMEARAAANEASHKARLANIKSTPEAEAAAKAEAEAAASRAEVKAKAASQARAKAKAATANVETAKNAPARGKTQRSRTAKEDMER